jgi:hypothetical protein
MTFETPNMIPKAVMFFRSSPEVRASAARKSEERSITRITSLGMGISTGHEGVPMAWDLFAALV